MSPKHLAPPDSTRPSSDWTSSEGAESENGGPQTENTDMTSCSGAEPDSDMFDDDSDGDDGTDGRSTYAPSYYPNMRFYDAPIDVGYDPDNAASTRSLFVPDLGYQELFGRRYCRSYFLPNDEDELARQTLMHQAYLQAFGGELTSVSLDSPTKILDIGTGTGEWAIRMGELHPDCEVIGTDISAVQETSVPPNVFFEIDDAEAPWERPAESFDLVHLRQATGAFKDLAFLYRQAQQSLKPGGWIELVEIDRCHFQVDLDPDDESASRTLAGYGSEAARKSGRAWAPLRDPRPLIEAGFVDVRITEHVFPFDPDSARGSVAKMFLISILEGLEAFFLRLLVEQLDMDPEEVRRMCDAAAMEMVKMTRTPAGASQLAVKLLVLTARKPHPHETIKPDKLAPPGRQSEQEIRGSGSAEETSAEASRAPSPASPSRPSTAESLELVRNRDVVVSEAAAAGMEQDGCDDGKAAPRVRDRFPPESGELRHDTSPNIRTEIEQEKEKDVVSVDRN